jgi:hypothetical protein
MKKLLYSLAAFVIMAIIGMTSCGPSAAEKARLDSIRIADSLRVLDSIKIADSLKVVQEKEAQLEALRQKIDETAASTKATFVLKIYELGKVVYANEGMMGSNKIITVYDVSTDQKTNISLKNSADLGSIVDISPGNNDKQVVVDVHCGGSGPFYTHYTIDVEEGNVIRVVED